MKKLHIILLSNQYLLIAGDRPRKKGNYLAGVRLFETAPSTSCLEIHEWKENNFESSKIKEVLDWE